MPPPVPSPFPTRTYPRCKLYLYVDGIDLTPWANKQSIQNAVAALGQGSPESFSIALEHISPDNSEFPTLTPQPLPPIRAGRVQVIYIERFSTDLGDYNTLFSGKLESLSLNDDSWPGSTVLHVSTPLKDLKTVLRAVKFTPSVEPADYHRFYALFHKWGNPDWKISPGTPNITYPLPTYTLGGGEAATVYENRTVMDILNDICQDPGNPNDTGYPVPNRNWWIYGYFKNPADPTQGLTWSVQIYRGEGYGGSWVQPISDDPRDAPTALIYDDNATIEIDYTTVVRKVHIAGAKTDSTHEAFYATGTTPEANLGIPADGWIRKVAGVDGEYDTTAISSITSWQDFDMHWQVQESYLAHDPFQGDDQEVLGVTSLQPAGGTSPDPDFPNGTWKHVYLSTDESEHNSMSRKGKKAMPHTTLYSALALIDVRAATCIERANLGHNEPGACILARAVIDGDNVLQSALTLTNTGTYWELREYSGGTFGAALNASNHATAENDQIKINCKYNRIEVYWNDVIDPDYSLEPYEFNAHETLFGIAVLDDYSSTFHTCEFTEFNVTEFWGDKAIGVGTETTGEEWFWIGYGFVFNVNGTYTLVQGGTVMESLGVGGFGAGTPVYTYAALNTYQATHGGFLPPDVPYQWIDVLIAHNTLNLGFSYDDVYQMTVVRYALPTGVGALKAQWWKQPGGAGNFILLREELNLPVSLMEWKPLPLEPATLYHQVSLKELGATFTNMGSTKNYANLFLPPADLLATMTPLEGDFPATGTIQRDWLTTYVRREKIAHAIFKELGEPRIRMTCIVGDYIKYPIGDDYQPYYIGYVIPVTNRRAGWIDHTGTGGTDDRKLLMLRGMQRIEGGAQLDKTRYRLILGDPYYDFTDPARTHLLSAGASLTPPENLELPELTGLTFGFQSATTQDGFYGEITQIRINALGTNSKGAVLPTFEFPSNDRKLQIPHNVLPPGTQFEAQHRTVAADGTPSPWSKKYGGTVPQAPPYQRPWVINFPIGQGGMEVEVGADAYEMQINEAAALAGWAIALNGPAQLSMEVEWCSDSDRRNIGDTAYASLVSTGTKPYTLLTKYAGKSNQGTDLRGWLPKAQAMNKGDWLRVYIFAVTGTPAATKGTLALNFQRVTL